MNANDVSVVVPVYNGGEKFARCVEALLATQPAPIEIIAVDDGSTDHSRDVARSRGVTVLQTEHAQSGPGVARNLGAAQARGAILFFVDADVLVYPDAVARVADAFGDAQVSAIFGSYDDAPADPSFLSQYKNLMHHYVHQTSRAEATSFWAGCGAIRQEIFLSLGGFAVGYTRPSIEDIELGYRLRRAGYRMRLIKDLRVKHLKQWTWRSLLMTDIFDRALPWAELLLRERKLPADLNLQASHRLSALLVYLLLLAIGATLLSVYAWALVALLVAALIALNFDLYRFFFKKRGWWFTLRALPLHWFYYAYGAAAFIWVFARSMLQNFSPTRVQSSVQ